MRRPRSGAARVPDGSVVDVVARHRDADGERLDPHTTAVEHRCPGEQVTVAVLAALAVRLARLEADVPPQDLSISLRRIPTRPTSGVVLRVRKTE